MCPASEPTRLCNLGLLQAAWTRPGRPVPRVSQEQDVNLEHTLFWEWYSYVPQGQRECWRRLCAPGMGITSLPPKPQCFWFLSPFHSKSSSRVRRKRKVGSHRVPFPVMVLFLNLDSGTHLLFNSIATSSSSPTWTCPGVRFPHQSSFDWFLPAVAAIYA